MNEGNLIYLLLLSTVRGFLISASEGAVVLPADELVGASAVNDLLKDPPGGGGDGGGNGGADIPGQGTGRVREGSLLGLLSDDGEEDGVLLVGDGGGSSDDDGLIADIDHLSVLGDNSVDLGGDLSVLGGPSNSLGLSRGGGGDGGGGGQDRGSGLGDQGSVGDLDFLGDLVGENGDSEDGGEAGDGEDGSNNDGGLHGLDRPLNVGQLSLEAGHGASSLGFHNDCLLVVTSVFEFVFVKVSETRKCKSHIYLAEDKKNFAEDKEIFFLMF